jgi:hypothetical protein
MAPWSESSFIVSMNADVTSARTRIAGALVAGVLTHFLTGNAYGQAAVAPTESAKPKTFALIAAFGDQISLVSEVQSTGSRFAPYRRSTAGVESDGLNRLVLVSLGKAIASIHPDSKRIYMALPSARMEGVASSQRESVAIGTIIADLEKMPQRLEWDRIVVAMPAYRALELNGLAGRLRGFGLFSEPLCQGCGALDDGAIAGIKPGTAYALTSDGDTIRAKTYIAPFSYLEIWVLDPKTLAVLDRQVRFDSQKLAEPGYKPAMADFEQYLLGRMANLINLSVSRAVANSELNGRQGKVEVGEPTRVDPNIDRK